MFVKTRSDTIVATPRRYGLMTISTRCSGDVWIAPQKLMVNTPVRRTTGRKFKKSGELSAQGQQPAVTLLNPVTVGLLSHSTEKSQYHSTNHVSSCEIEPS